MNHDLIFKNVIHQFDIADEIKIIDNIKIFQNQISYFDDRIYEDMEFDTTTNVENGDSLFKNLDRNSRPKE